MTTPTTYPSAKAYLGLAVETTMGTANTTIAKSVPLATFEPEDKPTWLDDKAIRGSMVETYGRIQGPMHTEWAASGPVFFDVLPYWLANILGDLTTTGPVSSAYTHTASVLNSGTGQPGSLTLVDWQGPTGSPSFARMYPGACLSELTLKGNAESSLVEWGIKGLAYPSADYPTAPPSQAFSTDVPMADWRRTLGLGGTAAGAPNLTVRNWELTIQRELKAQWTGGNTQSPYVISRGPVSLSGSLYYSVPSTEQALDYLLSNTQPQGQLVITNGGADAALRSMTIDVQLLASDTTKINRSEVAVGFDATIIGVANTTNAGASGGYSPIKIAVVNATASYA